MLREVILISEARDDLRLGRDFYDSLDLGVGEYFLSSLKSEVESLKLHAGIHPIIFGYYRLLAKRFPFGVYYENMENLVRIVAILDLRQDPDTIRASLSDRSSR
ncbi:hypothetical protein [Cerasicoccus fimbriatus]|uniref:hypothetical protein n=1 Tax=Cerasicoccus fimbriatus TaxID=3014554 RepID=UPI0022B3930D|nr:hypothetical protein [Cerasicoccus sp. TK19100]